MAKDIFKTPEQRAALLGALAMQQVKIVLVDFAGSGDSGSIEGIFAYKDAGEKVDLTKHSLMWTTDKQVFKNGQWVLEESTEIRTLHEILEQLTYDALDVAGLDWYNNDGGQGHLEIDFNTSPPTITLDVGINYVQTDQHSFDFSGRGEDEGAAECTPTITV